MTQTAPRAHPGPATYWGIALFLAALTAVEISVPYTSVLEPVKVPLLLLLGAIKFVTVAGFFMHLRYDKKLYRNLFMFGAIGVFPLFIVVLLSMHAFA
jgi:cytochrome c oxidase subunit 4